jgi:hypothetical protein
MCGYVVEQVAGRVSSVSEVDEVNSTNSIEISLKSIWDVCGKLALILHTHTNIYMYPKILRKAVFITTNILLALETVNSNRIYCTTKLGINDLKTKRRLLYLKTQSVPYSKHV